MLSMGLTLTLDDFKQVYSPQYQGNIQCSVEVECKWKPKEAEEVGSGQCMKNPVPIGVGYLAQYIVKPLLGYLIAKVRIDLHD